MPIKLRNLNISTRIAPEIASEACIGSFRLTSAYRARLGYSRNLIFAQGSKGVHVLCIWKQSFLPSYMCLSKACWSLGARRRVTRTRRPGLGQGLVAEVCFAVAPL